MSGGKVWLAECGVNGVAPTGEPALLASGARMAERQPASSERSPGWAQRTSGETAGATPRAARHTVCLALVLMVVPVAAPAAEWNQWGGSPVRNNTPDAQNLPIE